MQEHFLQDSQDKKYSNTNKLRNQYGSSHDMYIVPAFKENRQVSRGRGVGGLATLWSKNLTKYVSRIKCNNFRIQATKFSLPDGALLLINTYFPGDPRTNNFDDAELLTLLSGIQQAIQDGECNNVLVAGDLNCHFARKTRFTDIVKNYFIEAGLTIFWENSINNENIQAVDYTHMNTANRIPALSTIDHFVSSMKVFESVVEAGVIHSGMNQSNHSPIYTKIQVGKLNTGLEFIKSEKRVAWDKATDMAIRNYKTSLSEKLNTLALPDCHDCQNLNCKDHNHSIEEYTLDVLQAVETCAQDCLPSTGGGHGRVQPTAGWTEYVKPFCEESKFWSSIWYSSGKPSTGPLYELMRSSKSQYKYAVRRLKRVNDKIQNEKFVKQILKGGANIFQEIRKFRGNSRPCSSRIDEEVGSQNISEHFAQIYGELYNRSPHSDAFDGLCTNIDAEFDENSLDQVTRIDEDLVNKALKMMKSNKKDAQLNIQSDCLVNGPPELVYHLTMMMKLFVVHGTVPNVLLLCTLLPLVKDNLGDITSSDNYRAIASGSLVLKLLDIVILLLESEKLGCDVMQFGFQATASTTMCTWTVSSVIDHYLSNGRSVYGCAMDLSKAFDMVEWKELFITLMDRGVERIFLRVLLYIYRNQECHVKWGGKYSTRFSVRNGVRQGAVTSPILFSVYIDDLFQLLRNSGFGCHISNLFYACFGYADDLFLLSASRSGLQVLVKICEQFAKKKGLKFSTNVNPAHSKTKCIIFSKRKVDVRKVAPIVLNNNPLPWVSEIKHLGNILQSDNKMTLDISQKRGKLIGKLNSLQQEFHYVEPSVFVKILNIYACSFYGSSLWDIFSAECDRIYSAWNVAIRICFNVDRCTHRYFIEELTESLHPKVMLCSRYIGFQESLAKTDKFPVKFLASLCQTDQRTVFGRTLRRISLECSSPLGQLPSKLLVKKVMKFSPVPEAETWRLGLLNNLLDIRCSKAVLPGFTSTEVEDMIRYVCVD